MQLSDKAVDLCQKLEALHPGVSVIDLQQLDRKHYAIKVSTPMSTYITRGTAAEILNLVKQDLAAANSFECVFCKTPLLWPTAQSSGQCPSCHGHFAADAKIIKEVLALDMLSVSSALACLKHFTELFKDDRRHRMTWGRLPESLNCDSHPLLSIEGPDVSVPAENVPLILHTELAEDYNVTEKIEESATLKDLCTRLTKNELTECVSVPTCEFCVHCATLNNMSANTEPQFTCVYPLVGLDFCDSFRDEGTLDSTDGGFHLWQEGTDKENINGTCVLWDALMNKVLEFIEEKVPDKELKAFVGAPLDTFVEPVCSRFKLDTNHIRLQEFPYAPMAHTVTLNFDVIDLEKSRKAREEEEMDKKWPQVLTAVSTLREDPKTASLFATKINTEDVQSANAMALVELLEQIIPPIFFKHKNICALLSRELNLSKKAAVKLDAILQKRADVTD